MNEAVRPLFSSTPRSDDPKALAHEIVERLTYRVGKDPKVAKPGDWLQATILIVRDRAIDRWMQATRAAYETGAKRVYYLSLEFLIGRLMRDAVSNLGLTEPLRAALAELDVDFDAIAAAADRRRAAAAASDRAEAPDPVRPSTSPVDLSRWCPAPAFPGQTRRLEGRPPELPSDAAFEALVPRSPQPFPLGPGDCPGVLGEVAAYIDEASATATEAGALAVALPVLGAVMGRTFATPSNLRTNILSVALGGSGSGKTSLVNPAKELLRLAGVAEIIGQDRIASGSGLLRMLTVEPRRICFLDEFGHLLQQIGAPGAGIHSRQILTEFTRLYSDAGTLYTGTAYAGREPEPIDCPHLCLFGMATPEQFWRAFGSSSLEDGSIARFLVFPIGAARIKDPNLRFQPQALAAVQAVVEAVRGLVRGNLGRPAVLSVDFDERADAARLALQATMQACAQYAELNGVRLELSADVASAEQLERESHEARARLDAWTARKAQWRQDRAKGLATGSLKPQQNDRPEVAARAAAASQHS